MKHISRKHYCLRWQCSRCVAIPDIACEQALLFLASEASLARTRERGAARSRVLARLVSLAQIRELARRLSQTRFLCGFITCAIFFVTCYVIYFYGFA